MDTQQKLELNDSECIALYLEAMELNTEEATKINKEAAKINKAKQRNDKEALRKIIKGYKTPQGMKFDPIKERDRCIKELHAVRFKKKTLYVYDPDKGYTSDLGLIRGCVAEVYRNEYVSINQQDEVIKQMERYAPPVEMAARGNFIHFKNGILDLNTLEFKEGVPDSFILHKLSHNYNPNAPKVELVDRVFNEWTKGNKVKTDLLLAWIAYCCLEDNPLHKFVILKGPQRNGKTVICNLIGVFVGDENISAVPMKHLDDQFKTSTFGDKLANVADENTGTYMPENAVLKAVTGQGVIDKEAKGKDSFRWQPITKMTFAFNENFSVKDCTGALKARLIPIILDADFTNEALQDKDLLKKLSQKEAVEYFFTIAIPLLHKVLKQGYFDLPEDSIAFLKEQKKRDDSVIAFCDEIKEGIEINVDGEVFISTVSLLTEYSCEKVYEIYHDWCEDNGLKPKGSKTFAQQIRQYMGFKQEKARGKVKDIDKVEGNHYTT